MDRDYIDEHDIVGRYVRGQLNEEEMDTFEVYMLENPSMVEEVRLVEAMRDSFKQNATDEPQPIRNAQIAHLPTSSDAPTDHLSWLSIAASIAAIGGLLTSLSLLKSNRSLSDQLRVAGNSAPVTVTRQFWLVRSRGEQAQVLNAPDTGVVIVQLDAGLSGAELYTLKVSNLDTGDSWVVDQVSKDQNGLIPLALATGNDGSYEVIAESTSGDGDQESYRFELR